MNTQQFKKPKNYFGLIDFVVTSQGHLLDMYIKKLCLYLNKQIEKIVR